MLHLLDDWTLAHLGWQQLNQTCAILVVYQFFGIVSEQEIAELIVDVRLGFLDDQSGKTLIDLLNLLHAFLLFLLWDVIAIDVFSNAVDFLTDDHYRVIQYLPLVVAGSATYT